MRKLLTSKITKTACFALLLSMFLFSAAWAAPFRVFTSGPGGDFPLEDAILNEAIPNVLFYLDVSAQMTMSMTGMRPTSSTLFSDANVRQNMLRQDTFGMGGRPLSEGTMAQQATRLNNRNPLLNPIHLGPERNTLSHVPANYRYQRWGRDIYAGNNIIGHPDHYYSLDPARPYLLTFRDPVFANWNGIGSPPSGFPTALMPFLPQRGPAFTDETGALRAGPILAFGDPVPLHLANRYLVPNDSKMYAMKLVLSRLLTPERENMETLSRMRIGVATSFYERAVGTASGAVGRLNSAGMKNYPFRFIPANASGSANFGPVNNFFQRINGVDHYRMLHNGVFTWIPFMEGSGIAVSGSFTAESLSPDAQLRNQPFATIHGGVNSPDGIHHVRSIMHIPFDVMYMRVGANYYATPSLIQFREMIDGVEQINYNPGVPQYQRFVNDEFFITAIPGSAERLVYNVPLSGILYATGVEGARTHHYNPNATTPLSVIYRRIRNSEGLMTGTAAGGLLDFFSPRPNRLAFNAGSGANGLGDTRGFFPVTSSCQGNWIIYFTTGNENNPGTTQNCINNPGPQGNMMHSLGQIFRNSTEMRGRENLGGGDWAERNFLMENPIRTIVVGLVSTEGIANDGPDPFVADDPDNIPRNLRNRIRRIAQAGQPLATRNAQGEVVGNLEVNPAAQPIFADNVPELLRQLNDALVAIRTERLSGGALRMDPVPSQDGSISFFSSSYLVDRNRQWDSIFARYRIPLIGAPYMVWEANALMMADAAAGTRSGRVYALDAGRDSHHTTPIRTLVQMNSNNNFHARTGIPNNNADRTGFLNWLISYRWTDGGGNIIEDNGILGSMERNRALFVPRDNPETIFIQTNRGVLHALDYATGQERWAFIPPQILFDRLWRQKFRNPNRTGWIDGDGVNAPSSIPLLLLDGLITASTEPVVNGRTFLIGALGLAGNAIYMMNVTDHATDTVPTFMWSIDNNRFGTASHGSLIMQGAAWVSQNSVEYMQRMKGWEDLGLTMVAPEVRQLRPGAGNRFVGLIPGGLGYNLGFNAQGIDSQGRSFFVFEPLTGRIIRNITTAETRVGSSGAPVTSGGHIVGHGGFVGPPGTVLGMGITPVYYVLANPTTRGCRITSEMFTGDSEGNILYMDMGPDPTTWQLKTIFRTRTIEPGSPPNLPIALPIAYEIVFFPSFPHTWSGADGARMGARWLFGGTANVVGPGQEYHPVTNVRRQRGLYNEEQYIFALNLRHLGRPGGHAGAIPNIPAGPSRSFFTPENPPNLSDLTALHRGDGTNGTHPTQPAIGEFGWKLRLAPPNPTHVSPDGVTRPAGDEYVTIAPHFNPNNAALYVATFTPFIDNAGDLELDCGNIGFSRLYAFDATTGRSIFGNGDRQFYQFHDVKIVGLSSYARTVDGQRYGYLFLGLQGLSPGAIDTALAGLGSYFDVTPLADGAGASLRNRLDGSPIGNLLNPTMMYWREVF